MAKLLIVTWTFRKTHLNTKCERVWTYALRFWNQKLLLLQKKRE